VTVSQRERSFLAHLGKLEAESHAQAAVDHLSLPVAERLTRSWALFESFRQDAVRTQAGDEGPLAFYQRARALGLYRE
jgi:hypothetical protein